MTILLGILALVLTFNMDCPAYSMQSGCTVTLMNGSYVYTTMTESYSGSGVVLPELTDTADWHFLGWTETLFHTVYKKPEVIAAGSTYHPNRDITLWAVYQYRPADPDEYMSEVKTGDYLYVNRDANIALKGIPSDGKMGYATVNKYDNRLVYHIDFVTPDTAYITHKESNTPIGYASKKMAAKASPWLVYHSGEETLFYAKIENVTYVLWLNILDSQDAGTYAGLTKAAPGASPMSLMVAKEKPEEVYTCYPNSEMGMDEVQKDDTPAGEYVLPFGNYRLRIRSGHKYLQIEK